MAVRLSTLAAAAALTSLAACQPMYGPPAPGRMVTPTNDSQFSAGDFAWSKAPGHNALVGSIAAKPGMARYGCAGATVVLTPETPWSRRRMGVLYQSDQRAALPVDQVRARTNQAPPGDSEPFVRRATCDAASHFSFAGLPDGSWYVVTIAKPAAGAGGPTLALMKRVTTRGGKATAFEL